MAKARLCSVDGCGRPYNSRGFCESHYYRFRKHGDPLAGKTQRGVPGRYLSSEVIPYTGDDCLIWPFAKNSDGYGCIGDSRVCRIVCDAINGPPPTPLHFAAHSCGKGQLGCVSPKHLRWALPVENSADMVSHGNSQRGRKNVRSKLSEDDVRQIRSMIGTKSKSEIARSFGVTHKAISFIQTGQNWGWLD